MPKADVFISYVSQDEEFANELAERLQTEGVVVQKSMLGLGDSLTHRVEQGLQDASYGILILSESFFMWPWSETDIEQMAGIDRRFKGSTLLLSVWFDIDQQNIARYSETLATRVGVPSKMGLDVVIKEILRVVKPTRSYESSYKQEWSDRSTQDEAPNLEDTRVLRGVLADYFSEMELRDLCFDLYIDYDDLPGSGKRGKARELIAHLQRRGRLDELVKLVLRRRPNLVG